MKLKKLTEVMEIRGVRVYAHWSVLLIGTLILFGAIERPAETLAAWTAYFGVILIHECGHMVAAQWKRCEVIAWGGVVAQAVVAVPLVTWVAIFGFTRSDAVNVAIGILGYYSLIVAAFNLVPLPPLDGAKAWYLIPGLIKRARTSRTKPKRVVGWRGW
jgi:membrane-associated protease RseP (regulator of RpoE activity)